MRILPIYFLLDADVNINEAIKVQYQESLYSITKSLRSGFREFQKSDLTIELNIIQIGDEPQIIVSDHLLSEVLHLKLIFEGQSNYLKVLYFLKDIFEAKVNEFYYTPIIISFLTKPIDEKFLNLYRTITNGVGAGNSHPDFCEIFIGEYIDYNYIILFNENKPNLFDDFHATILSSKHVDQYNFRGEVKESKKNLVNWPTSRK
jgi:hypothetical protein